jgi:membrane protein
MAWLFRRAMPRDTRPTFVWPKLVATIEDARYLDRRWLTAVAAVLIAMTIAAVKALLLIPGLDSSVVNLLTRGFATFLPRGWATGTAWTVGVAGVFLIGDFTNYTKQQKFLHSLKATGCGVYDTLLLFALMEEQAFRSGSEKWSWRERVRASVCFGLLHITNIWYNFSAGIALSVTGFGFLLVYLWYYRKYRSQIIATATAATVHALYNAIALSLIAVAAAVYLAINIAKML